MREIKIADKALSIRGLKRTEIKKLKEKGFNIENIESHQVDDLFDMVFPMLFSKEENDLIDDSVYRVSIQVWKAILAETFGAGDEEKNSSASGNGSQTEKE